MPSEKDNKNNVYIYIHLYYRYIENVDKYIIPSITSVQAKLILPRNSEMQAVTNYHFTI